MIKTKLITLFAVTMLPLATFATTYSPYVDITLDTHWDQQYQDMEPQDLIAVSKDSNVKNFRLAFINDAGNCTPAWGSINDMSVNNAWGKHLTDKMTAQGISYIVGFGGAAGTDLSSACNQDQLTAAFEQVVSVYHPQGLDFDIENGTANVPKLMAAIKKIEAAHPNLKVSFTLPVMPEGLPAIQQDVLKSATAANVNYSVNLMTMDFGGAYSSDMAQYAIQALTNTFSFLQTLYPQKSATDLWQMLQATPMIGVNDVTTEHFTLADADALVTFANQNKLGALAIWSIGRDQPCSSPWPATNCSGANMQTQPYEFTKHFLMNN